MPNQSPRVYQRQHEIRDNPSDPVNDRPMTAKPRYGKKTVLSHRRGEKRMEKWLKHV